MKKICSAAVLASLSMSAYSQSPCEAHETLVGGECMYDGGNFGVVASPIPRHDDEEVPFFQDWDWRDEPWGNSGGGGPSGDDDGNDDDEDEEQDPYMRCSSVVNTRRLMTQRETESFEQRDARFANWVAFLSGATAALAVQEIPVVGQVAAPFIGGGIHVWISNNLTYGPLHCGDTIKTKISTCIDFSIWPDPNMPAMATRSIDTVVLHTHLANCSSGYVIPEAADYDVSTDTGAEVVDIDNTTHVIPGHVQGLGKTQLLAEFERQKSREEKAQSPLSVQEISEMIAHGIVAMEEQGPERSAKSEEGR